MTRDAAADQDRDGSAGLSGGAAIGGAENTFDHPDSLGGPAVTTEDRLRRFEEEGPPGYTARLHACPKPRYRSLGRFLASRGVDIASEDPTSAGFIFRNSDQALGRANYGARLAEVNELTVASASRLFDIFIAAAPEIIANLPTSAACSIGGAPAPLFDESGECLEPGVSCLLGMPASVTQLELCSELVGRVADREQGKRMAIAAMLSAVNTCE